MAASDSSKGTFELRLGAIVDGLRVLSLHGVEEISSLFSFDVIFTTDIDPAVLQASALGQPATLLMLIADHPPRIVQGLVSRVRSEGALIADQRRQYSVRIVPRMWLLKRRRASQIFQEMTTMEVVSQVIAGWQIPMQWSLERELPKRSYCVQYEETDYEFVTRLLAQEGVFFYFEPPSGLLEALAGGAVGQMVADGVSVMSSLGLDVEGVAGAADLVEKVVFGDATRAYLPIPDGLAASAANVAQSVVSALTASLSSDSANADEDSALDDAPLESPVAIAPPIPFRSLEGMSTTGEFVYAMQSARRVRSKSVHLRDFSFKHPTLGLDAHALVAPTTGTLSLNGGAPHASIDIAAALDPEALEVYEHHGEFEEADAHRAFAHVRLEQLRAHARRADGASTSRRLSPGHVFRLEEHLDDDDFNRDWVVTRVEHHGRIPEIFSESERSRPDAVYRNEFACVPATVAARPAKMRRKLQQVLESATVVGPPGEEIHTDEFGRIKVQFHWDREGRRDERSSCWIRVMHAWAGTGWGFQFIPRIGMEVLVSFLGGDADRPMVIGSVFNQTHPVPFRLPMSKSRSGIRTQSTPNATGYNELSFEDSAGHEVVNLQAQRDLVERAGHDHMLHVGHHQHITVAAGQEEHVSGDRHDAVQGNESRAVRGVQKVSIDGDQTARIGGKQATTIGGVAITTVDSAIYVNNGNEARTIHGTSSTSVGAADEETAHTVFVYGAIANEATQDITIRSDTRIVLECGKSQLVIGPESITVQTKKLIAEATDHMLLKSKGPVLDMTEQIDVLAKTINLWSKGGVLELDKDKAKMDAPTVVIGNEPDSPPDQQSDSAESKTQKFKWTFLDGERQPLKDKTYTFVTAGMRKKGTTNGDGAIELDVPKGVMTANVTVWLGDFPTSERRHYSIRLGVLPPASGVMGAQIRLRNLGYYAGKLGDQETPELAAALTHFQRDYALPPTGELDGATSGKLDDLHPTVS